MISIAMATYNGEKYVAEQIDSILRQTFTDFELIICDDASSDRTAEILTEYAGKDARIKLFFNEKNLGFKKNFEKIISLCGGDLIAFSDQDDIWLENHLSVLNNNIGDADLISADSILFYGDEKPSQNAHSICLSDTNNFYAIPALPQKQSDLLYRFLANTMCTPGHNMLVKREFILKYLPIPEAINYHDAWFAAVAVLKGRYMYIPEKLTFYRQHPSQVTKHMMYSYWGAFKNVLKMLARKKKYKTDRIGFMNELRKLQIDEGTDRLFSEIENFLQWRMYKTSAEDSKRAVAFFKKYYRLINTRRNDKYKFIRLIELKAIRFASR